MKPTRRTYEVIHNYPKMTDEERKTFKEEADKDISNILREFVIKNRLNKKEAACPANKGAS